MRRVVVLVGMMIAAAAAVARMSAQSDPPAVPVVVELFTSEGCSDCPAADALLADLVGKQPVKGARVIALGEHVDYFNHQGWRDPYSDTAFTFRQSLYRRAMSLPDLYTPQMIIDGAREVGGNDRAAVFAAVAKAAAAAKPVVNLTWAESPLTLKVTLGPHRDTQRAQIVLAVVEDGLKSDVTRGENKGRSLHHAAVVRRLDRIGTADNNGLFDKTVPIELKPSWNRQAVHAIVLAQARDGGRITAAGVIDVR